MSPKKIGKLGIVIHSQGLEIVSNVLEFMKKEAVPLKNYR